MILAVPKEVVDGERRVALVPESVKKLVKAGADVVLEAGAGVASYFSDDDYQGAGATIEPDVVKLLSAADFIAKVQPPVHHPVAGRHEVDLFREGAAFLTTLYPTRNLDAVRRLAARRITSFAADCIPRTTRAQTMDVLSSMANIAGYKGVILAADQLAKYFPMFMTAAGTVFQAKVFVIGAGVAGLQAIATAKRLGATVTATDTRPVVREQVESVGGKFVGVDASESAQDAGGYAKELSKDFYDKQAKLISDQCAINDVVVTTALIGGVKAPKLITEEMVRRMKPGSVLIDLAAEGGGNCVLSEPGKMVEKHNVKICAPLNLPSQMPLHASTLYSRNVTSFLTAFLKDKAFNLDWNDEILKGAVITHFGEVMHGPTKDALSKAT
ncbi:MAG: Re/Si-specific NAD(P)(+) transhydrogenase subunit alpha [Planctomycetota bacterium]